MDELFVLDNSSLVLHLIHYLSYQLTIPLKLVTVIYQQDCWIIRIKGEPGCPCNQERDLEAVLWEFGEPFYPDTKIIQALMDLELGRSLVDVMQDYSLSIVSHGLPNELEVEIFRRNVISKLGFCP